MNNNKVISVFHSLKRYPSTLFGVAMIVVVFILNFFEWLEFNNYLPWKITLLLLIYVIGVVRIFYGVQIIDEYLKKLGACYRQIIFLASVGTFIFSLISIVLGINSDVIQEYIRVNDSSEIVFNSASDILDFPISQLKMYEEGKKEEFKSFKRDSSRKIRSIIVLDVDADSSSNTYLKRRFQELLSKNIKITDPTILKTSDFVGICGFAARSSQSNRYMNNKYLQQELYVFKPTCSFNGRGTLVPIDYTDQIDDLIKEFRKYSKRDQGCYRSGLVSSFAEVLKPVLQDKSKEKQIVLSVFSDFDEKGQTDSAVSKAFLESLEALSLRRNVKINLFRFDQNQLNSSANQVVESFKDNIDPKYLRIYDLRQGRDLYSVSTSIFQELLVDDWNPIPSEKLVLSSRMVPYAISAKDSSNGFESSIKLIVNKGRYEFQIDSYLEKYFSIVIDDQFGRTDHGFDQFIEVKESVDIVYSGPLNGSFLGKLRVKSVEESATVIFPIWYSRVLDKSTIGFIYIGLNITIILLLVFIYLLLECIPFSKLINESTFLKRFTDQHLPEIFQRIWVKRVGVWIVILSFFTLLLFTSVSFKQFVFYFFDDTTKSFKDAYWVFAIVMVVFMALKRYDAIKSDC